MDQYKGILFFDYDGTLVDDAAGIYTPTQLSLQAMEQARANGYLLVLATGRTMAYIQTCPFTFDGYVSTNGAYGELHGKELFNDYIAPAKLHALSEEMKTNKIAAIFETQKCSYCTNRSTPLVNSYIQQFKLNPDIFVSIPADLIDTTPINKVFAIADDDKQLKKLKQDFSGQLEIELLSLGTYADITDYQMSKGIGVRKFYEALGILRENTYAFGDGMNDYTMLQCAGHGIAMGRHMEPLKNVADYITKTVAEEGIAHALQYYHIIE
ncbi:MAG: HAD family hydrolase [Lachnospiraceae bacterium]